MKKITITSWTGSPKDSAVLVRWTAPTLRPSYTGRWFEYQTGFDASGVEYETKSRGGGWRVKRCRVATLRQGKENRRVP